MLFALFTRAMPAASSEPRRWRLEKHRLAHRGSARQQPQDAMRLEGNAEPHVVGRWLLSHR